MNIYIKRTYRITKAQDKFVKKEGKKIKSPDGKEIGDNGYIRKLINEGGKK